MLDRGAVPSQIAAILVRQSAKTKQAGRFFGPKTGPRAANRSREVNWTNVITVISAAILIGTEIIGAGFATGWAIAGLFGLGNIGAYVLQALFGILACYIIFNFVRRAAKIEPFFDR
jgi:hypothetical protein